MNKEEICKNCKYHYIEPISFDYPQSICRKEKDGKKGIAYTTEEWLHCNNFEYSQAYIQGKINEIIDVLNVRKDEE